MPLCVLDDVIGPALADQSGIRCAPKASDTPRSGAQIDVLQAGTAALSQRVISKAQHMICFQHVHLLIDLVDQPALLCQDMHRPDPPASNLWVRSTQLIVNVARRAHRPGLTRPGPQPQR